MTAVKNKIELKMESSNYKHTIPRMRIVMEPVTEFLPSTKVTSAEKCNQVLRDLFSDSVSVQETFMLLLLDVSKNILGWAKVSSGGVSSTIVDLKILCKFVVQRTIENLASSVIIAHNHPSGSLIPSKQDENITERIKDALAIFEVELVDHIILSGRDLSYYSFKDEGLL